MNILITGTSRGIGKYLADHYSDSKDNLVFGCSRNVSSIQKENYIHYNTDLSSHDNIIQLFRSIKKDYGRLDVLVNSAAINIIPSPFVLIPEQNILDLFNINLFAPMTCCREAVKVMSRNKFGRIINLSSMAVRHEVPGESIYTSSKAALTSFTRVLAKEVNKIGITCNVVAPSAIETGLLSNINKDALNEVINRNAIHHHGEMKDVSNAIDWIISPESCAITGQVIYLGGV
jgi:3-oxoacyl-[acyl-carrier protein] reductase